MITLRDLIETRYHKWYQTITLEDYNLLTNELKENKLMAAFIKYSYRNRYGNDIYIGINKYKLNDWLKAVRNAGFVLKYIIIDDKTYRAIDHWKSEKKLKR